MGSGLPQSFHDVILQEIIWNPDRNIFVIPYLNHPVTWYGFLFALGFIVGFVLVRKIFTEMIADASRHVEEVQIQAVRLTDRLTVLVVLCGIIGARLGHVFFYDWSYYRLYPLAIFKIWEGGLASHGGAVGIFIALLIFVLMSRKEARQITFMSVLDTLVIPAAFAGGCIRVGNFINQEITGIPTQLPWAVIFMNPLDGIPGVAVHPVQIYEALFYFCVFGLLMMLWKSKKVTFGTGKFSGWFFLLVFGFRFIIEYLKMPQNEAFDTKGLFSMGQLLSIPFIILGILLLVYSYVRAKE